MRKAEEAMAWQCDHGPLEARKGDVERIEMYGMLVHQMWSFCYTYWL